MDKLVINKTFSTPQVNFDAESGLLEIEGQLIPEDPENFFLQIVNWIDNFNPDKNSKTLVRFKLSYYNTSSTKRILNILKKFDDLFQKGSDIKIIWEYEEGDEDTMQDGEDYKSFLKVPCEIRQAS